MLVAGDDPGARRGLVKMAETAGIRCIKAGRLDDAVEARTSLGIWMNRHYRPQVGVGVRITGLPEK